MSVKTDLEALITGFTDGGQNTAAEFRTFATSLLNSVIPDPINDTQLTTNVLTAVGSVFAYDLTFWKQGAFVFFKGFIRNPGGNTQNYEDIATITNAAYLPLEETFIIGTNAVGNSANISFVNNKMRLNGTLTTNNAIIFNGFYPALN